MQCGRVSGVLLIALPEQDVAGVEREGGGEQHGRKGNDEDGKGLAPTAISS